MCIYIHIAPPPHRQVLESTIQLHFPTSSTRTELPCERKRSLVSIFTGKLIIFECFWTQDTPKTGSRALFAAEHHHISLYSLACNSKCTAGSPT